MKPFPARWGLLFPVHLLRGERVFMYRTEISKLEIASPSDIRRWQIARLSKLLAHVYLNDPYYRRILTPYPQSQALRDPSAFFALLPFLTKDIVRQEEATRSHSFWSRLDHRSTSGSTGSPFAFWKDHLATGYMQAVQDYAYGWHGLTVGDPQARFWGMPLGRAGHIAGLKDRLKNRIRFSAFNLSEQAKRSYYQHLLSFKPTYFYGYPSLMLEFARFVHQECLPLNDIPLKVVVGTGEHIYPHEREELEHLLSVPYAGEYGCSEVGVIGFDCPQGRMHMMASNIFLEVVDSEGRPMPEGEEGEIVITELNSRYLPFIRYRLGDRGRFTGEMCPCGRTLPVFEVLAGRKDDYIITPEGEKVYDAILAYTLKEGVLQFKAVQDRLNRLRIYVRPDRRFTKELQDRYVEQLQQVISPEMMIEFIAVEEIKREKSGKMRYFRSEISKERL